MHPKIVKSILKPGKMIALTILIYLIQFLLADTYDGFVSRLTINGNMYNGTFNFKNISGGQSVDANIHMKEELTNNNKYFVTIQRVFPNKMKTIFTLPGTGTCTGLETYMGEAWLEAQKMAKVENVGACPIKKSNYKVNNFVVKYGGMKILALVPNGKYRLNAKLFDITGKKLQAEGILDFAKLP